MHIIILSTYFAYIVLLQQYMKIHIKFASGVILPNEFDVTDGMAKSLHCINKHHTKVLPLWTQHSYLIKKKTS